MYISSLKVSGFKSIGELDLDFQNDINIVIGKNNVGKSNILKALNTFFNKSHFDDNDFPLSLANFLSNGHVQTSFIELVLKDIPSSLKEEYPAYIYFDEIILRSEFTEKTRNDFVYEYVYEYEYANTKSSIRRDTFQELLPSFIYLGDLSDKNISVQSLNDMFKIFHINDARKIETYANQLIKNIWDQQIAISISLTEDNFDISIIDEYGNSNSFEYKSSGVQQLAYLVLFFSFSIVQERSNYILALEEPETNLHVGIQKKLFKYLKSFSSDIQLFLTTHSSIFLDRAKHESIYHAVRNDDKETVITKNGIQDNWLLLRNDLGLSISDSLFLGKYNILVEGVTEKIILPIFLEILHKKKAFFSLDDINIISAEGANNLHYFAKLITQTGLPTCILIDNDQEGRNAKTKIEKDSTLLGKCKVIILERDDFENNEFEDMIDDELLINSLNKLYESNITLENLHNARLNIDHGLYDKFSKYFSKLKISEEEKPNKVQIAYEIKQISNEKINLEFLSPYFKEMNKFFKQF